MLSSLDAFNAAVHRQFGVTTRAQAGELGFTRHGISRNLSTRAWLPVHRGVY